MSFASDILPDLDVVRGIAGDLGLHPFAVYLRVNTWSGDGTDLRPGLGTLTSTTTRLFVDGNQNPKVKNLSNEDAMLSAGQYSNQDIRVGPLTPPFLAGGVAYSSLDPDVAAGTEFFFKIVGPGQPATGEWFKRIRDEADSALHIYVILRSLGSTPPGGP